MFDPASRQYYKSLRVIGVSIAFSLVLLVNIILACEVLAQNQLLLEEKKTSTGWDEWSLSITPYAWFAGQSSDVGGEKLTQSFSDLASITDLGFQGRLLARWRWIILALDYTYADLSSETDIGVAAIDMALTQHILDMKIGGIIYDTRTANHDEGIGVWIGGGARYWDNSVNFNIKIRPILPGGSETIIPVNASQAWWDPVIGLGLHFPVTSKIGFLVQATGGGFGIGDASDYIWDAELAILFRLSPRFMLSGGYRQFKYDRSDDDINQTVTVSGPFIGLSIGIF